MSSGLPVITNLYGNVAAAMNSSRDEHVKTVWDRITWFPGLDSSVEVRDRQH